MTTVGFIGLGDQGAPMAHRIVEAGFPLVLWARRPESLVRFQDTAARTAPSPSALGSLCDVVCICVVTDADVEEILLGEEGVLAGMSPGGTILIHSTIYPETVQNLARQAAQQKISIVDAPVSGGGTVASKGKLLVMTGGMENAITRCRPILECYSEQIFYFGDLGNGLRAKLLNNLILTAQITLAHETFELAKALGIDRASFAKALQHGSGQSRAASILGALTFDMSDFQSATTLLRKDAEIIRQLLEENLSSKQTFLFSLAENTLCVLESSFEDSPKGD